MGDRDYYVECTIKDYISKNQISLSNLTIESDAIQQMRYTLIANINDRIELENQIRSKSDKIQKLKALPGYAVAKLLIATEEVKRLNLGQSQRIVSKRYFINQSGDLEWSGTYEMVDFDDDNAVMKAMSLLNPDATTHDERSMMRYLYCHAPRAYLQSNNKLVFFRNGVWNYEDKTFTNYDDTSYDSKYKDIITLAKLPVFHPLGSNAKLVFDENGEIEEPIFSAPDGTTWRPSECFSAPFSDDAIGHACEKIVWQLAHFTLRHMNGLPHLYHFWIDAGGKGHNGKSTLWELIQRLIKKDIEAGDDDLAACGDTVINCAIENLEKDYVLAQNITTAYAIVGEESNASTSYIENCAMVKMLSRSQEYTFRQIRQEPFSFRFDGALVQQCNKPPLFAEKSDSMFTHSVNIPFSNTFSDDRAYIKDDYIKREEVAEWLAYMLTVKMDALEAYDADALKTLEPFKREMLADGMSTMQALDEIVPGLHMNFMPAELLYDLYIRWCDTNGVTGRGVVSAKVFRDDLEQYGINNNYNIEFTKKKARSSMKDLHESHPALIAFGSSNKNCLSDFIKILGNRGNEGYLNPDRFSENLRGKIWSKGGLLRKTDWRNIKNDDDDTVEIDEDSASD